MTTTAVCRAGAIMSRYGGGWFRRTRWSALAARLADRPPGGDRHGRHCGGRDGDRRRAARPGPAGPADHPDGRGAPAALRRRLRRQVPRSSRSPWSCSATPRRPATACTAAGRRPARCSPPACPAGCTGRSGCTASPWSAPSRPACRHQVEAALECRARRRGDPDRRQRRHQPHPRARLAVRYLVDAVRTLRDAGCEVVVGTCPDLGTIRPIQPPLRWLARRWSRQLAAAQTVGGGRGRRLDGLPRRPARPAVRRRAGPDVQPGTGSTRPPRGTRGRGRAAADRCCPRSARRPDDAATPVAPARAYGRCRRPPRRRPGTPAPRSAAPRSAAATAGRPAAWAQLRRRAFFGVDAAPQTRRRTADTSTVERTAHDRAAVDAGRDTPGADRRGWAGRRRVVAARRHGRRRRGARRPRRSPPGTGGTPSRSWAWRCAPRSAGPTPPPLRLVLLGDSSALGVGVDRLADTVGGQLAQLLAEGPAGRRVELSSVGVVRVPLRRPGHPGGPGAARRAGRTWR